MVLPQRLALGWAETFGLRRHLRGPGAWPEPSPEERVVSGGTRPAWLLVRALSDRPALCRVILGVHSVARRLGPSNQSPPSCVDASGALARSCPVVRVVSRWACPTLTGSHIRGPGAAPRVSWGTWYACWLARPIADEVDRGQLLIRAEVPKPPLRSLWRLIELPHSSQLTCLSWWVNRC